MRRTISELIAAAFAGEKPTQAEANQLMRHLRRRRRIEELLLRDLSPEDREDARAREHAATEPGQIGRDFKEYRASVLSNLRRYTSLELQALVREQLVYLGWLVEH